MPDDGWRQRSVLACPVCGGPLALADRAYRCDNGHSFDVAREGYVNLLAPQHRSKGIEGDLPEMLRARRRFLEAGHYRPLVEALERAVDEVLRARGVANGVVLDVGCGEGHYIGALSERLGSRCRPLGTDVSRAAVRMASKRYPSVLFFVSDVHRRVYLRDASAAVILDVFAPRNAGEFARVLEPGGSAFVVIPGPTHLASARSAFGLLAIEEEKERRVVERFADGFRLAERKQLDLVLELSPEGVRDLVDMGPSSRHGRTADVTARFATEASFVMLRFERSGTAASR